LVGHSRKKLCGSMRGNCPTFLLSLCFCLIVRFSYGAPTGSGLPPAIHIAALRGEPLIARGSGLARSIARFPSAYGRAA
jgi:hypothetical protein